MQSGNPYQGQDAAANKIITKNEYHEIKKEVIAYEKKNQNYIRLIPCSGNQGWYEIPDHSALFYYYKVCKPQKIKVSFSDDSESLYTKYKIGYIRTRDPETVKSRIDKANLLRATISKDNQIVFVLKKTVPESEINALTETELKRREQENTIVKVNHSNPMIYRDLAELTSRIHHLCDANLSTLSRETNGKHILYHTDNTLRYYFHDVDKRKNNSDTTTKKLNLSTLNHIQKEIQELLYELQIAVLAKAIPLKAVTPIAKLINQIEEKLNGKIKELE